MQTVVYRCLLVLAGKHLNGGVPLAPEQIEMVYWFAEEPDKPLHLAYDSAQFWMDIEALGTLAQTIAAAGPDDFPRTEDVRRCQFCTYRSLCDRGVRAGSYLDDGAASESAEGEADWSLETTFDQIAEIEF
jgi:hypothetical protein